MSELTNQQSPTPHSRSHSHSITRNSTSPPTTKNKPTTRSANTSKTPNASGSPSASTLGHNTSTSSGPLAHTLCTRLLTDGHVAAFSQAFHLLGLGLATTAPANNANAPASSAADVTSSSSSATLATSSASSTESNTSLAALPVLSPQHRINQARLVASPAHVQRLCNLLTAVEDARARLPQASPFTATPALWHATRVLAVFLTDVLPDAAVEYAKQALHVAQALADPPAVPTSGAVVPTTPSGLSGKASGPAAVVVSPEEAKHAVVEGHVLVGNACAQLGLWPAAMVEYRLALSVPEAVERLVYSALQYAGTQEHSPSMLATAIRIYKDTLLCIPPLHPRATMLEMKLRRRLGLAYMAQGDLTAAEVQLTQFLTWTQSHPRPTFTSAAAGAAEWPQDPVGSVSLALAECRELAGDLEGAVLVLTEYMNLSGPEATGPVRDKVAVVLGNLMNRLNRGAAVTHLLADSQGDAAACQLGIARGMQEFNAFLKCVNQSPQDMFRFMDEVREKYTSSAKTQATTSSNTMPAV